MESTYIRIRKVRARAIIARLRTLYPHVSISLHYHSPWELLVAVILSAQCTDKKVNEVTQPLFIKYPTIEAYAQADISEFERDIKQTGFYKVKAKNIIASANIILQQYNGNVPRTMHELITLPGVARKTANVVLGNAFGVVEGIAVDTHVKRLAYRFGLTDENDPNKIEQDLMEVVPRKDWFPFTYLLISYGREYCTGRTHSHHQCPLALFDRETMKS